MGLAQPATNNQALPEADKTEIDRLRTEHELYTKYAPEFDLFLAAYEGGTDFTRAQWIFRHQRENELDFQDRIVRAHNINYCEPIISFFTNFIFSETIDRNGGANQTWFQEFIRDVNRKGDSIDDYMRQVSDDMQIFGMSYTLVDAPPIPDGQQMSKADEQANNLRPYWVLIKPTEIVDWVVDDFDTFEYVKRRQMVNEINDAGEIKNIEKYTEFYPDRVVVNRIDITDQAKPKLLAKQTIDNTLGYIPLVVVRHKRSKRDPYMGKSVLADFAYNQREILNLTSLLDEFLYRQCFNILAMETDSAVPKKDSIDGDIGTSNVMAVPKGAEMPQYLTPPVDPAKFIQAERDMIIRSMFTRAAQDTLNELFNGEKASGFSQAQSFSKTVPFISYRADALERGETRFLQITTSLLGKEWDGKVKYKDRYELTNLTDAMTQLSMLAKDLQMPSETFVKEELKRLIHEFDGKLPQDILVKAEREIDQMNFKDWMETQKQALIGQPKTPAGQQADKSSGTVAESAAEARSGATKKLR